jgi:Uma2 family endonuclease
MSVNIQHRLFTVDDYYRMAEAGILKADDRVELIDGKVVKMSPIGSRHLFCVNRVTRVFYNLVGQIAIISVQNPIRLNEYSEPQPDVVLLKLRSDEYRNALPTPDDVLLIIEVSDTTLAYDRMIKIPLYARAGIPEVWIANLTSDEVEAYSEPVNGSYQKVRRATRGETLTPEKLPAITIGVDDIFG